ncbi:Pepsin-like aspartic protease a1, partial [Globisporangium splendens]
MEARSAPRKGQPSHIALWNLDNCQYYGSVSFGTPPQTFRVFFDTGTKFPLLFNDFKGSSDSWVPSHSCTTCGDHTTFDHLASSTFKQTSEAFEGLYGSGESYGKVGIDVITLGNFSVPGYAFAVLSEETGAIPDFLVDGVIGLAFVGMRKIEGIQRSWSRC